MDSKRPDVQLDDSPDEEGIVTKPTGSSGDGDSESRFGSLLERVRRVLRR